MMVKRFILGLLVGMAGMHWYIHSSAPVVDRVKDWLHGEATKYSDKEAQEAARKLFDSSSPED